MRKRAVRTVLEHQHEYGSQWEANCSVAEKLGPTAETVRKWVRDGELKKVIAQVFNEHYDAYGADKMWDHLNQVEGIRVARCTVFSSPLASTRHARSSVFTPSTRAIMFSTSAWAFISLRFARAAAPATFAARSPALSSAAAGSVTAGSDVWLSGSASVAAGAAFGAPSEAGSVGLLHRARPPSASLAARSPRRAMFPPHDPDGLRNHVVAMLADRLNPPRRRRSNPRLIKRKMPKWHVKRRHHRDWPQPDNGPPLPGRGDVGRMVGLTGWWWSAWGRSSWEPWSRPWPAAGTGRWLPAGAGSSGSVG
ncbi:MAG: transposase [Actinobacteria bacterium]|nr:transposase [Actinomycetota bacterium]